MKPSSRMSLFTQSGASPGSSGDSLSQFSSGSSGPKIPCPAEVGVEPAKRGATAVQYSGPNPVTRREPVERLSRRAFVEVLGAGLLVTVSVPMTVAAQRREGRPLATRLHLGEDGIVTVMTGKIEMGQGARAQLTQAAAEELRLPVSQVRLIMGDTQLVPDDGLTAGSRTTPSTVPAVRQAAAAARTLLVQSAARRWQVDIGTLTVNEGRIRHDASGRALTYAELAKDRELIQAFADAAPANVTVTPVQEWKVLGQSFPRPNQRQLVTGAHQFPSDIVRPGMLRGKILRPPAYGARLVSIDVSAAAAINDVVVVHEDQFVGVAAPTTFQARQVLAAIAATAEWTSAPHPASSEVYDYLRQRARGGVPPNPFAEQVAKAAKVVRQSYRTAYVQHAPLEPRAAVAEWEKDNLTVWTGTQNPFGYHTELARAFNLPNDRVRVIVPDFGSGFGGKHTGEAAIEAARLARAAGRAVSLRWTREEEFTWAYFRPAAVIEIEATLNGEGALTSWYHVNINSGAAAVETPYRTGKARCPYVPSDAPLRQGSYRTLAATANNFARECCMDELAAAAGLDPLAFRLAHLEQPRLRAVLEEAARRFGWAERTKRREPGIGVGLACGTEKGSFVAACVEVAVDREQGKVTVRRVCEVFECGAVMNPDNLLAQVQGCILMGLGPALREEMRFEKGRMLNATFRKYLVPRLADVPELEIHLLNRPDLPSAGGGETPIIAIAPAIANAIHQAIGLRVRELPIRLPGAWDA